MLGESTEIGCPDISGCTPDPVPDRVLAIAISVGGLPALSPKRSAIPSTIDPTIELQELHLAPKADIKKHRQESKEVANLEIVAT